MSTTTSFDDLWRRVRAGDPDAAAEMVGSVGPILRGMVRVKMTDPRLRRVFDSMDICQSVLASFFIRAAAGQYTLHGPEDLLKLLAVMAGNKLNFQARKEHAQRRDYRRQEGGGRVEEIAGDDSSPSHHVANQELLQEVLRRLSPEERQLFELRSQGLEWLAIAEQRGGSAEALRKKLARAIDREMHALGVDDLSSD
jgi:RNA polymerase sigma-70 factor (ECF subfamily)